MSYKATPVTNLKHSLPVICISMFQSRTQHLDRFYSGNLQCIFIMYFSFPSRLFSFLGDKQQLCCWHSAEKGKQGVSKGTEISSSGVNQILHKAEIRNCRLSPNK